VLSMSLRVNAPQVIHETIDGEVVIINLGNGSYYSLADTAEEIWELLSAGVNPEDVSSILLDRHDGDPTEVASAVSEFVAELCSDDLMVPSDGRSVVADLPALKSRTRTQFQPPRLERFTDMQHLIALDPIHEVDEGQGWPHT